MLSKSINPLIIKKSFYNYQNNPESISNNISVADFENIFESIVDFYSFNKNAKNINEVLSERINNIIKYTITKLTANGSLSSRITKLIINRIFYYVSTYKLNISNFYYNFYLLAKNNIKSLEYLNSYSVKDSLINYFSMSIRQNHHIMHAVISFLINNKIKKVSVIGIEMHF